MPDIAALFEQIQASPPQSPDDLATMLTSAGYDAGSEVGEDPLASDPALDAGSDPGAAPPEAPEASPFSGGDGEPMRPGMQMKMARDNAARKALSGGL